MDYCVYRTAAFCWRCFPVFALLFCHLPLCSSTLLEDADCCGCLWSHLGRHHEWCPSPRHRAPAVQRVLSEEGSGGARSSSASTSAGGQHAHPLSSAASSAGSDEQRLCCRICFQEEDPEDFLGLPFTKSRRKIPNFLGVDVCNCRGTQSAVHLRCVREWQQAKLQQSRVCVWDVNYCPTCKEMYRDSRLMVYLKATRHHADEAVPVTSLFSALFSVVCSACCRRGQKRPLGPALFRDSDHNDIHFDVGDSMKHSPLARLARQQQEDAEPGLRRLFRRLVLDDVHAAEDDFEDDVNEINEFFRVPRNPFFPANLRPRALAERRVDANARRNGRNLRGLQLPLHPEQGGVAPVQQRHCALLCAGFGVTLTIAALCSKVAEAGTLEMQ
ncbi:unnamed protein product [Amoebophrya sp. A120]|nr:unnamed protein product [Amoebophrya sp. A120]|eukprot:GSA120T00022721001.1